MKLVFRSKQSGEGVKGPHFIETGAEQMTPTKQTDWMKAFDRHLGRYQGTSLETYADDAEAMKLIRACEKDGLTIEQAFQRFVQS